MEAMKSIMCLEKLRGVKPWEIAHLLITGVVDIHETQKEISNIEEDSMRLVYASKYYYVYQYWKYYFTIQYYFPPYRPAVVGIIHFLLFTPSLTQPHTVLHVRANIS